MAEQTEQTTVQKKESPGGLRGKKLVLIDGHSILNRAFYGMPDLTNASGVHTGAVYGFLNILFKILDEEQADYLTVAFDVHAPTFRHEMYADYKGTRKPMPPELREQVPLLKKVLAAMDIALCEQAGLEADDILGTLAKKAEADGMEVSLVSGDRDLLQIASEHILVRIPKTRAGQTSIENYHTQDVVARYQVTPRQFIDVKALMGDTADNIPGVPKVGEKTATGLIVQYGSVDGVYGHLSEITKKALKETLSDNEDKARLSLTLATIRTDCDVTLDADKARLTDFYTPEAFALFTELGFKNYLGRFDEAAVRTAQGEAQDEERITEVSSLEEAEKAFVSLEKLLRETLAFYILADRGASGMAGLAVAAPAETYFFRPEGFVTSDYLAGKLGGLRRAAREMAKKCGAFSFTQSAPEAGGAERAAQEPFTESKPNAVPPLLACFDVKNQYRFLDVTAQELRDGIHMEGLFDLLLGAYLINPLKSDYTPEDVASEYLQVQTQSAQNLFGKKTVAEMMEQEPQTAIAYACRTASLLRRAARPVAERLREQGMARLYADIELPLSYVLHDMERLGVRTDEAALRAYSEELGGQIVGLEAKIHAETGEPDFNIASPKQLGEILFEKMGLPGGKKTKTGYSTAADIIKIAMIRVFETLHRRGLRSELILQIHDELLIETEPSEKDEVAALLHDCMRDAAQLKVTLETDVHSGTDWYEAK